LDWQLAGGTTAIEAAISSPKRLAFLAKYTDRPIDDPTDLYRDVVWIDQTGDLATPTDTVARVRAAVSTYAAAVTASRRWVVVSDYNLTPGSVGPDLRVLRSADLGPWQEIALPGIGDRGVAIAPLTDTSAIVAWSSLEEGLRWAVVADSIWVPGETVLDDGGANGLRMARRQQGGVWLVWASLRDFALITWFNGSDWSPLDTIHCAVSGDPSRYASGGTGISRESLGFPAVAWDNFDTHLGFEELCASPGGAESFGRADELEGGEDGILPSLAVDELGDAWVAFWRLKSDGIFICHTYARATTAPATITRHGGGRRIEWHLTEPAPGAVWSVLRAIGTGPFEPIATLISGDTSDLALTDTAGVPPGIVAYKIRRNSVDARYIWESEPALTANPPGATPFLRLAGPNPTSGVLLLEYEATESGTMSLDVHDLSGKIVASQAVHVINSPLQLSLFLPALGSLRSSLYFVSMRTDRGARSNVIKVAFLR
jgi:hypothetical protein